MSESLSAQGVCHLNHFDVRNIDIRHADAIPSDKRAWTIAVYVMNFIFFEVSDNGAGGVIYLPDHLHILHVVCVDIFSHLFPVREDVSVLQYSGGHTSDEMTNKDEGEKRGKITAAVIH